MLNLQAYVILFPIHHGDSIVGIANSWIVLRVLLNQQIQKSRKSVN